MASDPTPVTIVIRGPSMDSAVWRQTGVRGEKRRRLTTPLPFANINRALRQRLPAS